MSEPTERTMYVLMVWDGSSEEHWWPGGVLADKEKADLHARLLSRHLGVRVDIKSVPVSPTLPSWAGDPGETWVVEDVPDGLCVPYVGSMQWEDETVDPFDPYKRLEELTPGQTNWDGLIQVQALNVEDARARATKLAEDAA